MVKAEDRASDPLPRGSWRLIIDPDPRSGAANMALDQALAESAAAGTARPALRFYRWSPPAVSLGRHQPFAELNVEVAERMGYEIVRRPTGGRAILHIDELTYSITAARDEPRVRGGIMDAYLRISNALVTGLQGLGLATVDKAAGDVRAGRDVSPACFEVPSAYEITVDGRKLIGSAQSRRAGYVLQHGSLPLTGDITRLIDVLDLSSDEAQALRGLLSTRATTLDSVLDSSDRAGARLSFERVAAMLSQGVAAHLQLDLVTAQPTAAELQRAATLIREKYANPAWTSHR